MSGDMDKRRLVFSIVDFLNREMASDGISEDAKGILTTVNREVDKSREVTQLTFNFLVPNLDPRGSGTVGPFI